MSQFRALNSMPEWLASKGTGDSLGLSFHLKTGTNGYGMLDSFPIQKLHIFLKKWDEAGLYIKLA